MCSSKMRRSSDLKNHDLVVTMTALPADGQTLTVTGTLLKDKDFGMGYKYDVLIENAEIVRSEEPRPGRHHDGLAGRRADLNRYRHPAEGQGFRNGLQVRCAHRKCGDRQI